MSSQANKPSVSGLGTPTPGRAILWAVPRSRSSILAKCLAAMPETSVWFANYMLADWVNRVYVEQTGEDLPAEYCGNEAAYAKAAELMVNLKHFKASPERMGYGDVKRQIESDDSKYVFVKDQAHGVFSERARQFVPAGFNHVFLIRDPTRVFSSIQNAMVRILGERGENTDNLNIFRDDPCIYEHLELYKAQHDLWQYVRKQTGSEPLIIDSHDMATNPRPIVKEVCDRVGFPYQESLLSWQPSGLLTTGWKLPTPHYMYSHQQYYTSALKSTCFVSPGEEGAGPIPRDQLTDDLIECVDVSMPYYQEMSKHKFKV
ncbi:uncharacterized protein [Diadema antillarum]|uniref:uncharacterized protein n=1 Tax=Diadema antillarum TaxID=105358 RepID=UPI003A8BCBA5